MQEKHYTIKSTYYYDLWYIWRFRTVHLVVRNSEKLEKHCCTGFKFKFKFMCSKVDQSQLIKLNMKNILILSCWHFSRKQSFVFLFNFPMKINKISKNDRTSKERRKKSPKMITFVVFKTSSYNTLAIEWELSIHFCYYYFLLLCFS